MLYRNIVWLLFKLFVLSFAANLDQTLKTTTDRNDLECEFPPKDEQDLTRPHMRTKRLTTDNGLVCLEDYPYTVSVRLHRKHWCGGAIVDKRWVLSAAQCFDYVTSDEVTVRMGSVFRDYGGKIMSVTEIKRHPKYKIDQYYPHHNLALIKLNMPIPYNDKIQIVNLAPETVDRLPSFGEIVVTGFGSVISGQIREGENQELRRMMVQEIAKGDCRRLYGHDYYLQEDHICLLSTVRGVALCAGDTGDPAVHFTGLVREGTLHGIALFSGTEQCAFKSKPGIFARISPSRKWIDSVIGNKANTDVNPASVESSENTIPLDIND